MHPHEIRDLLLKAFDEAIEQGDWESSLFYKNILKRLQKTRDYIAHELTEEGEAVPVDSMSHEEVFHEKEGYERLYIALYQSEGSRLDRWFPALKMLTDHSISRPVYRTQEDVEFMIKTKQSKNDAYCVVWVKQSDIIPSYSGFPLKDRWEHELVNLKEKSIKLENILEFVHDGKRYQLRKEELMLKK